MRPSVQRLLADPLRGVVAAISAITVLSGLGQLVAPGLVLDLLGAESTPTTRHFFAIVGMFMAVVGAVTLQALLADLTPPYVVLWCAVQKFGAFVAVSVGVVRDLFDSIALLVALFDLLTAVLAAALWHRLRRPAAARRERVHV
jgi:hypothetical protein